MGSKSAGQGGTGVHGTSREELARGPEDCYSRFLSPKRLGSRDFKTLKETKEPVVP